MSIKKWGGLAPFFPTVNGMSCRGERDRIEEADRQVAVKCQAHHAEMLVRWWPDGSAAALHYGVEGVPVGPAERAREKSNPGSDRIAVARLLWFDDHEKPRKSSESGES